MWTATDERGAGFPPMVGSAQDIDAYELHVDMVDTIFRRRLQHVHPSEPQATWGMGSARQDLFIRARPVDIKREESNGKHR